MPEAGADGLPGNGIARQLLSDFEQALRQKGIHRYFVSTDPMSNYGFCKHFGMRRAAMCFSLK